MHSCVRERLTFCDSGFLPLSADPRTGRQPLVRRQPKPLSGCVLPQRPARVGVGCCPTPAPAVPRGRGGRGGRGVVPRSVRRAGKMPLAPEGQEWQPGREYDILDELGGGEGRMSVVFRIRLLPPRRGEYALKMVVHYVGETAAERHGHARSTRLRADLGAEWQEPLRLPPHDCLVPILHHYHSAVPRLQDHIADPVWAAAAADRTLFLVMPLYPRGSLRSFMAERRATVAAAPHGQSWEWFGSILLRMLVSLTAQSWSVMKPTRLPICSARAAGCAALAGKRPHPR
jgi:hypothetical protein